MHDLLGMRVELARGQTVGTVDETYELPQGLTLDVRRVAPRETETVMLSYDDRTIASVDKKARVIVVTRRPESDSLDAAHQRRHDLPRVLHRRRSASASRRARRRRAGSTYRVSICATTRTTATARWTTAPYGGGAGMVMKPEPFFEAVDALGAERRRSC